jgi:hypothetical protein
LFDELDDLVHRHDRNEDKGKERKRRRKKEEEKYPKKRVVERVEHNHHHHHHNVSPIAPFFLIGNV